MAIEAKEKSFWEQISGDEFNILLLLLLYTLQGVPIGLTASVPLLLAEKGANFNDQTIFGLTQLPFSLKLIWAPLVDGFFSKKIGRRKSWLIPCQIIIGLLLLYLSSVMDFYFGQDTPDLKTLTILFFILYFFTATQDIAVDGWCLTMLKEENITLGPTLNSIGQTLGYSLAFTILLTFNNVDVCNSWFRSEPLDYPLITFTGFLQFWGWVFLFTTTLIAIFKQEKKCKEKISIWSGYAELKTLMFRPSMQQISFYILLHKIGFITIDACTGLRLIDYGLDKETLALLGSIMTPIAIFLPVFVEKYCRTAGSLKVFVNIVHIRLIISFCILGVVYWISLDPSLIHTDFIFYSIGFVLFVLAILTTFNFVAQMIFFSTICDPVFGGTHMTLLNTVANLGSKLLQSISMPLVEYYSTKECTVAFGDDFSVGCGTMETARQCAEAEGSCELVEDGFFVTALVLFFFGVLWSVFCGPRMFKTGTELQDERRIESNKVE